jgi:hypothetical protein
VKSTGVFESFFLLLLRPFKKKKRWMRCWCWTAVAPSAVAAAAFFRSCFLPFHKHLSHPTTNLFISSLSSSLFSFP